MRVILDTSVIVSGMISPNGSPAQIVAAWSAERFILLYSKEIYIEYADVLQRAWIHERLLHVPNRMTDFLESVRILGEEIVGFISVQGEIRDPFDEMFLRCARLGQADYLVSADKDLLSLRIFKNTQILTPGDFVGVLSTDSNE